MLALIIPYCRIRSPVLWEVAVVSNCPVGHVSVKLALSTV